MSQGVRHRSLVVWCPDWPVVAAQHEGSQPESGRGVDARPEQTAVAVVDRGAVHACSAAARVEGVRRGMRKRDAVARCPQLVLVDHDPVIETRAFERVLRAIEEVAPGVEPLRPGLCALRVPSRFYGGEPEAAAVVAERCVRAGVWDVRFGVADGVFAAEQAARRAPVQECVVVPAGGSAPFLAPLAVGVLEDAVMVGLLRRLGITTLGGFAALGVTDVATRFGTTGARAHRLARGLERSPSGGRRPPPELTREVTFSPGLETIEPIAFSARQTTEAFVAELAHQGLVCTTVLVEVVTERDHLIARRWSHPRWFDAVDLVDRLRWQLQADPAPDPVALVRFVPDVVESIGDRGDRLLGSAPDEQVERAVARVQGLLGYDGVLTVDVQGGRDPAARQLLTPWGEQPVRRRPGDQPWPGHVPGPPPSRVFDPPLAAEVLDAERRPVGVSARGVVSAPPARFRPQPAGPWRSVSAWGGPWSGADPWWEGGRPRRSSRWQLLGGDGSTWLLALVQTGAEPARWWTEAGYG